MSSSTSSVSGSSGTNYFTGSSQFSSDLQQTIQNAVALASLPMEMMQNDLTALQSQSSELSTLESSFMSVQNAINDINSAIGASSYTASSSNTAVATASISGTPDVNSLSFTVVTMGQYETAMSNDSLTKVTDPSSASFSNAASYSLQVGTGPAITVTPSAKNLSALADAINQTGAAQASVINIGPPSAPDYRLFLQANQLGSQTLQLTANNGTQSGQTLLTAQSPPGAEATYQVNGQPSTPISSTSRTVTVEPGVFVTMQGAGTATVSVSRSTAALSNAFSELAGAYNSAMTELSKNRGSGGGALVGDSIVQTLISALRSLVGYSTGNSGISNLTALGFSLDKNGVLSFDPSAFATAANGNLTQLTAFLGALDTGGFLKTANDALTSLDDSTSGLIQSSVNSVQDQITQKNDDISAQQDKITQMQTNLQNQMAQADAAISALEQQYSYVSNLFTAMQTDSKNNG